MLDILIAAIGAAVTGLGVWCLMAILERSGPDEGRTPQADLTGGKAKQNITHNLPVAIDLPLPVGEINGHRTPKGAEAKLNAALDRLIERKEDK